MPSNTEEHPAAGRKCDVLAARIRVNAATEIRVLAQTYSGRCHVHIRQYFLSDENDFKPTTKGISVPVEKVGAVLDAVSELRNAESTSGTVAVIEKSPREEIRFSVVTWEGATKADIRSFFLANGTAERKPGRGIRLNLALLVELERGLEALEREVNG